MPALTLAGPTVVDLNDFVRGSKIVLSLPTPGRVEILNTVVDSPYDEPAAAINLKLSCNQAIELVQGSKHRVGRSFSFRAWSSAHNGMHTWIQSTGPQPDLSCELKGEDFNFSLHSETQLYPAVARLRKTEPRCLAVLGRTGCRWQDSSRPEIQLLKDSFQSFDARFSMLMGYGLSRAEFELKNPEMNLDFSRAPKLDLILMDTLQLAKDFIGVLTLRMLQWHAERGARVYVMSSQTLAFPLEMSWLPAFMKNNPKIHFSNYSSNDDRASLHPTAGSPGQWLSGLHRTNHLKLLLTLSESDPSANAFISGGRNGSEMYFYDDQPDNAKFPELIQWGTGLYSWVAFDDLDFKVSDVGLTRQLARTMLSFNEDRVAPQPETPAEESESGDLQSGFFMAMPFDESRGKLEQTYVDLIDHATKSLHLVTPYLNLTPALEAAFARARGRGVDIHFVTNLRVEGDFMPGFLQPAMTRGMRKQFGKFRMSYYQRQGHILHVKALLMDDKYLVLGSVNLNQRSFLHDTEISMLFTDSRLIEDFRREMNLTVMTTVYPLERRDLPRKSIMEFLMGPFMGLM